MKPSLHPSLWENRLANLQFPPLEEDLYLDCCIIGGGIAGMSLGYLLTLHGKRVGIVDAGPIGGGETRHTTAHLSNAIDARYHEMIRIHGLENARKIAESHTAAIARIEQIVREEGIDCDFERVDGYLFTPPGGDQKELDREEAAARKAGLFEVRKVDRAPIPGYETGPALLFPRQAQFHPLKYLEGLRDVFLQRGGVIFGGTTIAEVHGGDKAHLRTADGWTIGARHIVVATNTPFNDRVEIHTKQAPYRTYAIAAEIPARSVPAALFWDTQEPYHYVRIERGEESDTLIVGGEDHKTGQADDAQERFERLEMWARKRFPEIRGIRYQWSGQVIETVDGIAFIGRNPMDSPNVSIATGDCGMGLTHGTIAGMLLSDQILGHSNPWTTLYDPARRRVSALSRFARENINVAAQYADYLSPGDLSSENELLPGCGAVLRHGLKKVAVYRDETGVCHTCSAICPHLKCVVHWNSLEKTWDCPCHGSRFSATGEVLNGPATSNLTPIKEPAPA